MARKKGVEHHGGAWKVAYADFMTAMMALFMVLWIIGQNPEVIKATADYFKDPIGYEHELLLGQRMISGEGAAGRDGSGVSKIAKAKLKEIADNIYQSLNLNKNTRDKPLDVFVTPDGIEVVIYDLQKKPIFDEKLKRLSHFGDLLIRSLAWTLDQHEGNLDISIYDPQLKEPSCIHDLQTLIRMESATFADNDRWNRSQTLLKSVFNRLIYHGFSLNKVQTMYTEKKKPEQAQHDVLMVDLSLHMNTETLLKR